MKWECKHLVICYAIGLPIVLLSSVLAQTQIPDNPQDEGSFVGDDFHGNNPVGNPFACDAQAMWDECWSWHGVWPSHEHHCIECYEVAYQACQSCAGSYNTAICINLSRFLLEECAGLEIHAYATFTGMNYDDIVYVLKILYD